jgi:hypothetical protein
VADFSGIEAVTATLRQLLLERMREPPSITTVPPDVEVPDQELPLLNLFLYRVTENAALKNQDLPSVGDPAAFGHPPLALDLHYLLTPTGQSLNDDRGAHRVLGDAMLTLHDHAIVAKDDPVLDPALQNEVELLKITLEPLGVEDLANVWTASTSPYRLSVAYLVTVVQLESTRPRRYPRPVLEPPEAGPRVHAVPLDRPVIASVSVLRRLPDLTEGDEQPVPYVRIGERLVVSGTGFLPGTRALFDDLDVTADVEAGSTSGRLLVRVPDAAALQPGVHRLQLVRDVRVGEPPDDRTIPFLRSNVGAFVLVPTVDGVTPGSGPAGTEVQVTGERLFAEGARTLVLVGDRPFPPAPGATATAVTVAVAGLAPGVYPVGVRVNGAESIDPFTFEVT